MRKRYKIVIVMLLSAIFVLSPVALFIFPYKFLSSVLSVLSALGLFVYYIFGNNKTSHDVASKKYSDILIVEEGLVFSKKQTLSECRI